MTYFKYFPIIEYNGISLRNIMLKAKIIRSVFDHFDVYYPYVLEDWERPDTIASDYYGDPKYAWIVLMSNDIIDPYYDWLITGQDFKPYLEKKYGKGIDELRNEVKHYKYTGIGPNDEDVLRKTWTMPIATYNAMTPTDRSGWTPVYVYDWEFEANENRRIIRLLDSSYLTKIEKEMKRIFE